MRQSMISIPSDYIEAASIDGASELRILWQVILPQCLPALAVLAVFSFRDSWDQYLWPLTIVSVDRLRTYPIGLVQFGEDYGNPPTEQMAVAVMATIPVFLLFIVLQRAIQRGFGLSGLKQRSPDSHSDLPAGAAARRTRRAKTSAMTAIIAAITSNAGA